MFLLAEPRHLEAPAVIVKPAVHEAPTEAKG
jgi:hypothetical protein